MVRYQVGQQGMAKVEEKKEAKKNLLEKGQGGVINLHLRQEVFGSPLSPLSPRKSSRLQDQTVINGIGDKYSWTKRLTSPRPRVSDRMSGLPCPKWDSWGQSELNSKTPGTVRPCNLGKRTFRSSFTHGLETTCQRTKRLIPLELCAERPRGGRSWEDGANSSLMMTLTNTYPNIKLPNDVSPYASSYPHTRGLFAR